jgi:hypothetical protein
LRGKRTAAIVGAARGDGLTRIKPRDGRDAITLRMTVQPERVEGLPGAMRRLIPEVRKEPGDRASFFTACRARRAAGAPRAHPPGKR